MAGGETSATKLKLHERRSLALTLRKGGMSIRDIAAEIERRHPGTKASPATVHDDLTKTMADAAAEILAEGKQVLALELLRLDEMQLAHWLAAVGGAVPVTQKDGTTKEMVVMPDIESAKLILKIMERRAKLLGLDKMNLQLADPDGNPLGQGALGGTSNEELNALVKNLLAAVGATGGALPPFAPQEAMAHAHP